MRMLTLLGAVGLLTCAAPAGDCCEEGTPPRLLRMIYLAEDCGSTSHDQDPDKVTCEDLADGLPEDVYVIVSNKLDLDLPMRTWFEGEVSFGDVIGVDAANGDAEQLTHRTCISILSEEGGALLQQVEFRTSCLEPLRTGNQFGAFLLVECATGPPPEDCCEKGRPATLTMQYTGDDCSATRHDQADDKVACEDLEPLTPVVYVRSTSTEDPDDPEARVWFEGFVAIDEELVLDAGNAGIAELRNTTYIFTYDQPDGTLLQTVRFSTSCNEPLMTGNRFGAYRLVGCTSTGGEGCSQGYWKQPHHFDSWPRDLEPDMQFSDVFDDAFPGMTLLQVLSQGGGKLNALGRKAVAALLNASAKNVSYDLAADSVVELFNDVYPGSDEAYNQLKDFLEHFNNQGCPLN